MANVVVFLAEGFEEIEGLATVDILRRAVILFIQLALMDKLLRVLIKFQ